MASFSSLPTRWVIEFYDQELWSYIEANWDILKGQIRGLSMISRNDTIWIPLKKVFISRYMYEVLVCVVGSKATTQLLNYFIRFNCKILSSKNGETLLCCSTKNKYIRQVVELLLIELSSYVQISHPLTAIFFLAEQNVMLLRRHITFSIAPAKVKISLLLFIFTHTK